VTARRGPAAAALLVLLAAVALLLRAALAHTGGRLVYALDDAYIHMAVARSLADHGVWGVTRYAFTSSTSSLAWPLLLAAADLVVGVRESTPLVLNLVFAAAAILLADRLLCGPRPADGLVRGAPASVRAAALVGLVLLTPLPTLVLAGMEHTLQVAAVLWLLDRVRAADEEGADRSWRTLGSLAVASALATAARYESLFLIAPATVVLALDRRRRAALVTAVAGLAPPAAYGLVAVAHGWPALPNSLLLKRATFEGTGLSGLADRLGGHALRALVEAPHLLVLLAAVLAASALLPAPRAVRRWDVIFAVAALLHLQLAAVGWLFRYEAYLVAMGVVLVARHVTDGMRAAGRTRPLAARVALALAALVASAPLLTRAVEALKQAPGAVKNIYEQQYQMGLFLRGLPPGSTVMANDIGAISYLADVRLVDLYGLATPETARARRAGRIDRALLARLAAETAPSAIVIYRSWFADAVPGEWVEVGTWKVPEKVVVADRTVSFLATSPAAAPRLARALAAFQPQLPPSVSARVADTGAR
jgi:hypothetical protein